MSEQRAAVTTYRIAYLCDECGHEVKYAEGQHRTTGFLGEEVRHRYRHYCPACNWAKWLDCVYPRFEYEPVVSLDEQQLAYQVQRVLNRRA